MHNIVFTNHDKFYTDISKIITKNMTHLDIKVYAILVLSNLLVLKSFLTINLNLLDGNVKPDEE